MRNNFYTRKKQTRRILEMRYHLKERAWTLAEAFLVRDDAGNPIFEIRGKFFHIGDDLVMYDLYNRQEVVHIKQRIISLLPQYEIYRKGQHWTCMHEQFRLFGELSKSKAAMAWSSKSTVISGG